MIKQRISEVVNAPLWRILKDAIRDETGSKIMNVARYMETGKPPIRKGWSYRRELTNDFGRRLVRDLPMPIDRFNNLIIRVMRRYGSREDAQAHGSIAVIKDEFYGYNARHAFIGSEYSPINTYQVRKKARESLRKKITEFESESLVMLAEFSYISELSKKEEIRWNTK